MNEPERLIPPHGGYRKLKSFQVAQLAYDVTVRFCDRYIEKLGRQHDRLAQAARSGGFRVHAAPLVRPTFDHNIRQDNGADILVDT